MARREHQMPNVHRQEGPRPYWYTRYRKKVLVGKGQISKKEAWHRLGYCDEITKRQALRLRDEILRDVNREVYTIQSHIRLADFVEIYQAQHIPTLAASVQAKYRSLLDVHLIPAFGAMKLCEIDTELLQRFLNTKEKEGLAWWTRSDLKNLLSGIFTKAADWGYWKERNPTSRVELGRKRPKRQRRILTDEELRSLLASLPDDVRLMVETAVSTGMRVSEIIGLKWQCVDFGLGCVRVTQRYYRGDTDAPKTEKSRRDLPLGHLANVYRQRKPDGASGDDYVFEIGGEPMDDRAVLKNVIRPTARRLGIYFEGFGWHSFRRQNLTVMQEVGATPFEAQAQAGHSRPAMTSEYTMVNLDRRAQSVLRLQERLFGVSRSALVN